MAGSRDPDPGIDIPIVAHWILDSSNSVSGHVCPFRDFFGRTFRLLCVLKIVILLLLIAFRSIRFCFILGSPFIHIGMPGMPETIVLCRAYKAA